MSESERPRCPFSLKDVSPENPYEGYAQLREAGSVLWDEKTQTWLVSSASACRALMAEDVDKIRFWMNDLGPVAAEIQGRRSLKLLTGDEQRRVHTWWLKQFGVSELERFRLSGIRPLVNKLVDRFIGRGDAEIIEDYSTQLPIRAIGVVLDLPWQDDEWVSRVFAEMKPLENFFNYSIVGDADLFTKAAAATRTLHDILRPYVEARRDGTGDDMISRLWREGPALLPDWDIDDVLTNARHMLFAGSETTAHAISSATYCLLTQPHLADEIRAGGDATIKAFVEEVLRLHGPVHYRSRLVSEDFEVEGVTLRKDEKVISIQSAANRDPARYPNPDQIDLTRPRPRDHIAFNYGPRMCVGAGLARMELQETVRAFLERMPDMQLNPDAEQPKFSGFQLRDFRPIHIQFTPDSVLADAV